ncbi:uncharacterized protein C1orf21 homolog isoform X1 [Tachysurus fulvidraco]|uniref:uncharacterized protein C1orf21 homolog isoform X1 n=1 Tax=Tachysurus fulvidraco TaxID=1234273 RepID=UPI001FED5653|nr:uncharacterized protein C1orf21 homolog isoform X1 [Tachysurus fulvidraco]
MGCASAKQLSSVPGDEEDRDKAHSNGDAFSSDEYKVKGVEKVKYMQVGEEERMNTRNQEHLVYHTHTHLEKSTFLHKGKHKEVGGNTNKISIHSSESQQEFFRMLDEKIEKGRDYCSSEEEVT